MRWISARTVVKENDVSAECDRLERTYVRFDDLLAAIEWLLARRCDEIESLKRTVHGFEYRLYRFAGDTVAGTPEVVVLYTYDDDEVNLIGIRAEEADSSEE